MRLSRIAKSITIIEHRHLKMIFTLLPFLFFLIVKWMTVLWKFETMMANGDDSSLVIFQFALVDIVLVYYGIYN